MVEKEHQLETCGLSRKHINSSLLIKKVDVLFPFIEETLNAFTYGLSDIYKSLGGGKAHSGTSNSLHYYCLLWKN